MSEQTDAKKKLQAEIIAEAWRNPDFKRRLIQDPKRTCAEKGLTLEGDVKVFEEVPGPMPLIIPPKPTDISDNDVDKLTLRAGTVLSKSKEMF